MGSANVHAVIAQKSAASKDRRITSEEVIVDGTHVTALSHQLYLALALLEKGAAPA